MSSSNDAPDGIDEKRRFPRLPVRIPAGIYFPNRPGEVVDAEILDLSLGGAFVHCTTPIRLSEDVIVEIRFAETSQVLGKTVAYDPSQIPELKQEPFRETSEIRWARGSSDKGFGIEFRTLTPEKIKFLSKAISYLQALALKNAANSTG